MTATALTAAHNFYAAIHAGDFAGVLELFADDGAIEFYGPPIIPFAGIFRGREKCRRFFDHVANDSNIREFRQDDFMTGDNQVAVTGHLTLEFKATGRVYDSDYVHVITTGGGKITRFRDFQDSARAAYVCADIETPVR